MQLKRFYNLAEIPLDLRVYQCNKPFSGSVVDWMNVFYHFKPSLRQVNKSSIGDEFGVWSEKHHDCLSKAMSYSFCCLVLQCLLGIEFLSQASLCLESLEEKVRCRGRN